MCVCVCVARIRAPPWPMSVGFIASILDTRASRVPLPLLSSNNHARGTRLVDTHLLLVAQTLTLPAGSFLFVLISWGPLLSASLRRNIREGERKRETHLVFGRSIVYYIKERNKKLLPRESDRKVVLLMSCRLKLVPTRRQTFVQT